MVSPVKSIRLKCLDCSCGQYLEIKHCGVTSCPLWRFRLGINPNTSKNRLNPLLEPSYLKGFEGEFASVVEEKFKEI